VAKVVVSASVW